MAFPISVTSPGRRRLLRGALAGGAGLALPAGTLFAVPGARAAERLAGGAASATAQGAAVLRALHQVIDYPRILDDPLAVPIIGPEGAAALQAAADRRAHGLRAFVALRSRYAEDRLAAAVARGVGQYVVLGAGLDTFAYRNPHREHGLRVFEVDHPATQRWKRARLQAAGIFLPPWLAYAPVDFETRSLAGELRRAGFDAAAPAFFSLLGVAIYLTEPAVMGTMRFVAACVPGSEVVFEFALPAARLAAAARVARERSMARVAALGEPWLTFFEPDALAGKLLDAGFREVEVLGPESANLDYFSGRVDGLRVGESGRIAAALV